MSPENVPPWVCIVWGFLPPFSFFNPYFLNSDQKKRNAIFILLYGNNTKNSLSALNTETSMENWYNY